MNPIDGFFLIGQLSRHNDGSKQVVQVGGGGGGAGVRSNCTNF